MATLLGTITLFKDVLVLNGSFGSFKANSSAPFKRDLRFCHTLKNHFKGGKRVSSDQPGYKNKMSTRSRLKLVGQTVRNISTPSSLP